MSFLNDENIDVSDFDYVITQDADITGWNKGVRTGMSQISGANLLVSQYIIEISFQKMILSYLRLWNLFRFNYSINFH